MKNKNIIEKALFVVSVSVFSLGLINSDVSANSNNGNANAKSSSSAAVATVSSPSAVFVKDLSNKIIEIKNKKLSPQSSKEQFIAMSKEYVAIENVAKFLLAAKYRTLSAEDKSRFIKCVTNLLANRLLAELPHGESIKTKITKVRALSEKHWLVTAEYLVDAKKYNVIFSIYNTKNGLKVFDIILNDVSASKIQRADIDGKIAKDGFKKFLADFFSMYDN